MSRQKKKKISFDNIWHLLVEADKKLGLFLLKEQPNKKFLLNWINKTTWTRNIILLTVILTTTLITTNFKLISVIFCATFASLYMTLYILLLKYVWDKETMVELLTWCKEIYDVEKKFHPMIHKLAETSLFSIEKQTTKVLKLFRNTLYVEAFTLTFGFLALGMVLPENILPRFTPPAPFYLPFKHQDNWIAFLMTMTIQTIIIFDGATICIFIFSNFFTVVIHALGFLDLIDESIKRMGCEMVQKTQNEVIPQTSQCKLDPEILKNINKSLNKNDISFDEWMKIITKMISDVNVIITKLSHFFSFSFLLIELASLSSLFLSGLIIIIVRQQYIFAIGAPVAASIFWIICWINEKILDKYDNIKASLYDIPWYELELKQRKTLIIALNCDEIQKGFTAAEIHNLTFEQFVKVIKAAYTNLLILRDLIQK